MTLRTKYALMTALMIAGVGASTALLVARVERQTLEYESRARQEDLISSVARMAQESLSQSDELMLVSYLMALQKEHPELAMATVTWRGHTSHIGADASGLTYVRKEILSEGTLPGSKEAAESPQGFNNNSRVMDIRMGFVTERLEAMVSRALAPLLARTATISAVFIIIGMALAAFLTKIFMDPLAQLAEAASSIGQGKFDVDIPIGGKDEVGEVATRFRDMAERIKRLVQGREDLLRALSHELKTPLSGLKGYLELWQERGLPEDRAKKQEVLGTMSVAVARMEESLREALEFFKTEHDQGAAKPRASQVVWINEVLDETLTLLKPLAEAKHITVVPFSREVGGFVMAPLELIRRVAVNLVSNAIKYTPEEGTITMGLESTPEAIHFWVSDTGYGIPKEDLPQLFTPFYRGVGAGRASGTGLGLVVVKNTIESMKGKIWVESELGKGSTFHVMLPVVKKPASLQEVRS